MAKCVKLLHLSLLSLHPSSSLSLKASLNYLCNNISGADLTPISLNSMESSGEGGSIGCIPVESGQTNHPELSTRPGEFIQFVHCNGVCICGNSLSLYI